MGRFENEHMVWKKVVFSWTYGLIGLLVVGIEMNLQRKTFHHMRSLIPYRRCLKKRYSRSSSSIKIPVLWWMESTRFMLIFFALEQFFAKCPFPPRIKHLSYFLLPSPLLLLRHLHLRRNFHLPFFIWWMENFLKCLFSLVEQSQESLCPHFILSPDFLRALSNIRWFSMNSLNAFLQRHNSSRQYG